MRESASRKKARNSEKGKSGPEPVDCFVGAKVRYRRRELGLSQSQLAKKLGITFQQVQKYEKGTNRMGASRLYATAIELGVPVHYFFDGLPNSEAQKGDGSAGDSSAEFLNLMASREAVDLCKSYFSLPNPVTRKAVARLVRSISEENAGKD